MRNVWGCGVKKREALEGVCRMYALMGSRSKRFCSKTCAIIMVDIPAGVGLLGSRSVILTLAAVGAT